MDTQHARQPAGRIGIGKNGGPYEAQVRAIKYLTPTTIYCQAATLSIIPYQPGQYGMVAVADTARAFSFATPPTSNQIEFLVDTRPQGPASLFWQQAQVGTPLRLTAPYGHFLLDDSASPLLYVAGGTGLAPIRAHLLTLLAQKTPRPLTLIVGHRTAGDVFWRDQLTAVSRQHQFEYHCHIGPLTPALLRLPNISQHQIYICGSAGMCTRSAETLYQLGASPARVHYELFT